MRTSACLVLLFCLCFHASATAQTIESAGSRALGMGGAFVAVASDSSATWWNPAGLAAGPFVDLALARAVTSAEAADTPAWRSRVPSFALGTPVVGVSFYRFRTTDAGSAATTVGEEAGRQGTRTGVPVRSVPASQLGLTLVHSVMSGVHVGATFKYVRGRVLRSEGDGTAEDLLDFGESLEGGNSEGQFDLDIGFLAVAGAGRIGAVVRNARRAAFSDPAGGEIKLPRQVRLGAAFDGDSARTIPLVAAVDADLRTYDTWWGPRRVVAIGVEGWTWSHRLGIRGGARFNTVGAEERAATAGVSVAIRSGLYLDGHVVRGGATDERGWGAAARVSF